ncbi:MAG: HAD family phosphatase [Nanoarchaeota archaeon]
MIIKAVLLDLDGLLVDSEPLHWKAWKIVAEENGASITDEEITQFTGVGNFEVASYLAKMLDNGRKPEELVDKKLGEYLGLLKNIKLMPGMKEFLTKLKKNHIRMAVVSGAQRVEVVQALQYTAIFSFFDVIICREDVKNFKPAPDSYTLATKRMNVHPKECVAFEDTQTGVLSAKSAGVFCIAVPNELSKKQNFTKADLIIESIQSLLGEKSFNLKTRNPMIGKLLG